MDYGIGSDAFAVASNWLVLVQSEILTGVVVGDYGSTVGWIHLRLD